MNKRNIRAFSFGIIFAVSLLGSYHFYFDSDRFSEKDAKHFLKDRGYKVLTNEEFNKLTKTVQEKETKGSRPVKEKPSDDEEKSGDSGDPVIIYRLEVKSGMNSEEIAIQLAANKIIADQKDFEQFLESNGYNTKIQLGIFELTNKMSHEEIANIITKSK